jgi:hypothetical protein
VTAEPGTKKTTMRVGDIIVGYLLACSATTYLGVLTYMVVAQAPKGFLDLLGMILSSILFSFIFIFGIFLGIGKIALANLLPAALAILYAKYRGIRSLIAYCLGAIIVSAIGFGLLYLTPYPLYHTLTGPNYGTPLSKEILQFAVHSIGAGVIGGWIYWLIAVRGRA